MGLEGINEAELRELSPQVTCPVLFLVQWDDEIVPGDSCFELFGTLGSVKKTMHANPSIHVAVPNLECRASAEYLDRYLR